MLKRLKEGYNKVTLYGGAERVTVEFERSSTTFKRFDIHSEPGICERIYWWYIKNWYPSFLGEEDLFYLKIRFAIKMCMEEANKWDAHDKEFEEKLARDNKTEADKEQELKNFVETL